jgi:hypothetical protein
MHIQEQDKIKEKKKRKRAIAGSEVPREREDVLSSFYFAQLIGFASPE